MSDNNGHPTPNNMPGAGGGGATGAAGQPGQGGAGGATVQNAPVPTPPWGTDNANYDPDTAATLIANLRNSEDRSGQTIKSQKARIAELEAQLSAATPAAQPQAAGTQAGQQPAESADLAQVRKDIDALKQQLTVSRDAALNSRARELAVNRDPNRPGSSFANPTVATRLIDLSDCLTADGQIDDTAIASKLDALAQSDPYLLAQSGGTARKPNPAQGQGNGSVSAADAQQIAEKNGDVKGAMHAAATQLAALTRPPQY